MRLLARISCTLAGLALLAPASAWAGMPIPTFKPKAKRTAKAPKKVCAACQYRQMTSKGIRVPQPPPLPAGTPVRGEQCAECGQPTAVVSSGRLFRSSEVRSPVLTARHQPPGRAVVGGDSIGLATTGEPTPIGMVAPRMASASPMSPARGSRDSSVMPTSMASDPISAPGHNRPHVLTHLLGLDGLGRERFDARARRKSEQHAMIPYGPQANAPVVDVPASVVFGRR